jgi:hypothetical protein
MKKNTEIVEFFPCPHCKKLSWELVDYIPIESNDEYSCLSECDHCGQEVLAIDSVVRCTKCEKKVECMAIPVKHTYVIAQAISSEMTSADIKKVVSSYGKKKK